MRFGENLARAQQLSLGVFADKWLNYRLLKKLLYAIEPADEAASAAASAAAPAAALTADTAACPSASSTPSASSSSSSSATASSAAAAAAVASPPSASPPSPAAPSLAADTEAQKLLRALASNPGEVAFFRQLKRELRMVSGHFEAQETALVQAFQAAIRNLETFVASHLIESAAAEHAAGAGGAGTAAVSAVPETTGDSPAASSSASSASPVMTASRLLSSSFSSAVSTTPLDSGGGSSGAAAPRGRARVESEAKRLLGALVRLMSALIQLENYAHLNYEGFGKALKKHDKLTRRPCKMRFMQCWVNVQSFAHSHVLRRMLGATEEAYTLLVALRPEDALAPADEHEATQLQELRQVQGSLAGLGLPLQQQQQQQLTMAHAEAQVQQQQYFQQLAAQQQAMQQAHQHQAMQQQQQQHFFMQRQAMLDMQRVMGAAPGPPLDYAGLALLQQMHSQQALQQQQPQVPFGSLPGRGVKRPLESSVIGARTSSELELSAMLTGMK